MKKLTNVLPQDKLYVGTSEYIAKLAPVKGLNPMVFLTDVYSGFFCREECKTSNKWGIISVSLNKLSIDMLAPSPAYLKTLKNPHKYKWQKSLQETGVCVYTAPIPPFAIERVMIFQNNGSNETINQFIDELPNPYNISPNEHKSLYKKSLGVAKWLNGEQVECSDMMNGVNGKILAEIEDKLHNRFGLDLYYIRNEERVRKVASKKKV